MKMREREREKERERGRRRGRESIKLCKSYINERNEHFLAKRIFFRYFSTFDPITTWTLSIIPSAINRCTRFACKLDDSSKPTTGHHLSLSLSLSLSLPRDSSCECTFGPKCRGWYGIRCSKRASVKIVWFPIDDLENSPCFPLSRSLRTRIIGRENGENEICIKCRVGWLVHRGDEIVLILM